MGPRHVPTTDVLLEQRREQELLFQGVGLRNVGFAQAVTLNFRISKNMRW